MDMPDTHPPGSREIAQVDAILAKFPGPVTLAVPRTRLLLGLIVCVGVTALFVFFWITPHRYRWYDSIMTAFGTVFFAGLTIRALILLFFPRYASVTLDAEGLTIMHVFYHLRWSWRELSDFRVEIKHIWRYGPHRHVAYAVRDSATGRPGTKKRMVPDLYGEPRLHGDALARLLNEWRERALALSDTSVPVIPQAQND
jgi:hypothetical protein